MYGLIPNLFFKLSLAIKTIQGILTVTKIHHILSIVIPSFNTLVPWPVVFPDLLNPKCLSNASCRCICSRQSFRWSEPVFSKQQSPSLIQNILIWFHSWNFCSQCPVVLSSLRGAERIYVYLFFIFSLGFCNMHKIIFVLDVTIWFVAGFSICKADSHSLVNSHRDRKTVLEVREWKFSVTICFYLFIKLLSVSSLMSPPSVILSNCASGNHSGFFFSVVFLKPSIVPDIV